MTQLPTLRCPSDPGDGLPALARTNYAACMGDSLYFREGTATWNGGSSIWNDDNTGRARHTRAACRGMFIPKEFTDFAATLDGLSNTIMAGEIPTDLGDRDKRTISLNSPGEPRDNPSICAGSIDTDRPQFWDEGITQATTGALANTDGNLERSSQARGYQWADGRPLDTGCFTILPPNGELCAQHNEGSRMTAPVGSRHPGGAHVVMGDGAVKFITDSIEAGDSTHEVVWRDAVDPDAVPGSQSPFGLWGALGSRAAKEVIEEEL